MDEAAYRRAFKPALALAGWAAAAFLLFSAAFPKVAELLGFSLEQAFATLLLPIVVDGVQTVGRAFLLLLNEVYVKMSSKEKVDGENVNPTVSVIVPAHNEEEYIGGTIESLLEEGYPNKEIIVVDDGSNDKTFFKASAYADGVRVKVLRREVASGCKAKAVNYGLAFSKGDVVVVVDGDTVVGRGSISELIKPLTMDPRVVGVSGNVKVLNRRGLLTRLQAYEYLVSMEMGRRYQAMLGGLLVIPGAFGAFRRHVVESLGRMHPDTITEDFDLTVMLHKTGGRVAFSPKAAAWTHAPEKLRHWIRQRMRWSTGQAQVYLKHSNLILKKSFGFFGLVSVPNNILMDMVMLVARYIWLTAVFLPTLTSPIYAVKLWSLTTLFYMLIEFCQFTAAAILQADLEGVGHATVLPLMVMAYRPLHSMVRLTAYMKVLFKRKVAW